MAINYLNSVNLNQNELIKAQVENQPNDAGAGTGVEGQLYFNTTEDILKIWADGAWVEVGGGVISLTAGTYLTNSGTATDPIIDHDNTTRSDSTSSASPGYGATFDVIASVSSNATGHVTGVDVKTITLPTSENTTYDLNVPAATTNIRLTGSDSTEDNVTISGTSNEVDVTRISNTELRIGLPDDVTVAGDFTVDGDAIFNGSAFDINGVTNIDVGGNIIGGVGTPISGNDAATKQYVDQAVTGSLSYQGGYNANTNTPDLDSSPSAAIKKGWTYTVTADGDFFTEQVRVGDVLIAENDAPTTLAEWTTVQNNIDLADASTVGIGNVNAGTGISVSYSNGTATVTNTETNSSNSATGTITAGQTSGTVTHTFGVNTIVQTIDSSGNTVYCDISRTATTSTATISTAEATDITILVQKIG